MEEHPAVNTLSSVFVALEPQVVHEEIAPDPPGERDEGGTISMAGRIA